MTRSTAIARSAKIQTLPRAGEFAAAAPAKHERRALDAPATSYSWLLAKVRVETNGLVVVLGSAVGVAGAILGLAAGEEGVGICRV